MPIIININFIVFKTWEYFVMVNIWRSKIYISEFNESMYELKLINLR